MSGDLGGVASLDDVLGRRRQNQDINDGAHTSTNQGEAVQVYAMDMDISVPMGILKARAGEALHLNLQNYGVWVLSEHRLSDNETLQEQCGTESGLVQVQFMVKGEEGDGRIDIIDVLKPNEDDEDESSKGSNSGNTEASSAPNTATTTASTSSVPNPTKTKPKTTRWIVSPTFKELQNTLKIPQDPQEWMNKHVRQWLLWATTQFGLSGIDLGRWNMTGQQLLSLSLLEFRSLAPNDPGDIFYMHFELLRRTGVVAVVCDPHSLVPKPVRPKLMHRSQSSSSSTTTAANKNIGVRDAAMRSMGLDEVDVDGGVVVVESRGGQQIQLWQFLLDLLTDPKVSKIISWHGEDGEFRLHQPEVVASLWGQRKSKPNMNYEKLSRALRYYYDGEMIAKVHGKRFVYKFLLDLRSVLGYSADQLKHMMEQCQEKDGVF